MVDLLVQLVLGHGGKIEEKRFGAIAGEFSSTALAEERVAAIVLAPEREVDWTYGASDHHH